MGWPRSTPLAHYFGLVEFFLNCATLSTHLTLAFQGRKRVEIRSGQAMSRVGIGGYQQQRHQYLMPWPGLDTPLGHTQIYTSQIRPIRDQAVRKHIFKLTSLSLPGPQHEAEAALVQQDALGWPKIRLGS